MCEKETNLNRTLYSSISNCQEQTTNHKRCWRVLKGNRSILILPLINFPIYNNIFAFIDIKVIFQLYISRILTKINIKLSNYLFSKTPLKIAKLCGFSSSNYFGLIFKQKTAFPFAISEKLTF